MCRFVRAGLPSPYPRRVPSAPRSTRPARGFKIRHYGLYAGAAHVATARRPQPLRPSPGTSSRDTNLGRCFSTSTAMTSCAPVPAARSSSRRPLPLPVQRAPPSRALREEHPHTTAALPRQGPTPSATRFLPPFEISLGPDAHRVPSDPAPPSLEHLRKRRSSRTSWCIENHRSATRHASLPPLGACSTTLNHRRPVPPSKAVHRSAPVADDSLNVDRTCRWRRSSPRAPRSRVPPSGG